MNAESTTAWGHGRHLTGRARQLSVLVDGARVPVTAPRPLSTDGLAGDVHPGGPERAVTVHPWEHYATWVDAGLPAVVEPAFGEQLTSVGLSEAEVFVGDTFRWGTAEVQVSAPAVPDPETVGAEVADRLGRSGHTGFHLRVVRAGKVGPDDLLELTDIDPAGVSLATVSLALVDGPAAAGLTAERLLLLRDVLPADLVAGWERLLPATDLHRSADTVPAAG